MDWFSIILGALAVIYGVYTLHGRTKENYTSLRLDNMKNLFGENTGDKVHMIIYGVVPLVLGALMFLKAFGISL